MFGSNQRQVNPIAQAISDNMSSDGAEPHTRFDEGVKLYWDEKPCPQDPEGEKGWNAAKGEVEYGHRD